MIPKIFHHTWPSGGPLKPAFAEYRQSFMKLHPDWTFMFWTTADREKYALSEISKALQNPDMKLRYIIISDYMRWEVLYRYGGVYLDTDVECVKNFDEFLKYESFAAESYEPNGMGNAVVGTTPGNPLMKEILEASVCATLDIGIKAASEKPWELMGVNLAGKYLTKIHKTLPRNHFYPFKWDQTAANRGKKFPDSYAVHWWSGMDPDGWTNVKNT
jgi:mannosyltransferase OCH1-like enzyme